jgi:hypothetical protein
VALGYVLWLVSLPGIPTLKNTNLGLLFAARPTLPLSIVVLVAAFVAAVRLGDRTAMAAVLLGTICVQRLTVTLCTPLPVYTWTYKHLGVVDYIQHTGGLAHNVDVYNAWPGLFTATAWFSTVAHVDPLVIAHWWTPAIHLLIALLVVALARVLRLDWTVSLTAALVVELANWVGQDYFSPQAIGYVLALAVLILALSHEASKSSAWLSLGIFAALVATHQLTPYWIIGLTFLLMLVGRLRPRWLPFAFAAVALAYLYPRFGVVKGYGLLQAGSPVSNASSNVPTVGTFGRQLTEFAVRGLALLLWGSSALAFVLQRRRREPVRVAVCVVLSSFALLAMQSYGGEAIFRVFLYALPGCALLLAPVLVRAFRASWQVCGVVAGLLVAGTMASMHGYVGQWFVNIVRPTELTAAKALLDDAQAPANITMAGPIWPERPDGSYVKFARYNEHYDTPMVWAAGVVGTDFRKASELDKVDKLMDDRITVPNYLVISTQMKIYCDYYGIFPAGALDRLRVLMLQSPHWKLVYDSSDVTVFLYQNHAAPVDTSELK